VAEAGVVPLQRPYIEADGSVELMGVGVMRQVVKQRLQAGVDKSVGEAVASIMRSSGPRGFYRGWSGGSFDPDTVPFLRT
jgi:hypothetical protein